MKGFTRDKKFVPMTDYNKVTRKSRDPKVKTQGIKIERKSRESIDTKNLNQLLDEINRKSSEEIEYGNIGGSARGLKKKGAGRFIAESMTKKEAINCLMFTNWIMDRKMESER